MKSNVANERWLSPHFKLSEFTRSGTAIRLSIKNEPSEADVERLRLLCTNVLEPLRGRFGVIRITSGFRCPQLNAAVGGVARSQHLTGEAADIHVPSLEAARQMADFIRRETVFDQLLLERRLSNGCVWLHVSYTAQRANRRQYRECWV
ncbi:MAG: DUF882 domain-containing protein [Prevotella sp.]|nr:DUF882 domain-containing protein [Prevotella sp.]